MIDYSNQEFITNVLIVRSKSSFVNNI